MYFGNIYLFAYSLAEKLSQFTTIYFIIFLFSYALEDYLTTLVKEHKV